jgi:hypothetical protein
MRKIVPAFIVIASILLAGCACAGETAVARPSGRHGNRYGGAFAEPDATPLPIDVSLYLPNAGFTGLTAVSAQAEDSPARFACRAGGAGALPDVNYVPTSRSALTTKRFPPRRDVSSIIVRLDLSDAICAGGQAVRGAKKKRASAAKPGQYVLWSVTKRMR